MNNEEKILSMLETVVQEVQGVKQEVQGVKQEVQGVKQEVQEIKISQSQMQEQISYIRGQQKENTDCIKALIHASETQTAQYDSLNLTLARIEGDVKRIPKIESVLKQTVYNVTNLESDVSNLKVAK